MNKSHLVTALCFAPALITKFDCSSQENLSLVSEEHRLSAGDFGPPLFVVWKMMQEWSPLCLLLTLDPPLTRTGHPCGDKAYSPLTPSSTSGWSPFSRAPCIHYHAESTQSWPSHNGRQGTWSEPWSDIWQVPLTCPETSATFNLHYSLNPLPTELQTHTHALIIRPAKK